jgi:hypothetical protein
VVALVLWWGHELDLPGVFAACGMVAGLVVASCHAALVRGRHAAAQAQIVACALAGAALALSVAQSSVRFDFYRLWAGEVSRLGEHALALTLYRKAERYAPQGRSRANKIRELERRLGRRDPG